MYEIDRRDNLHLHQPRPWRATDQAVCGATPREGNLADDGDVSISYGPVSYQGRVYLGQQHAVATHSGETRKVCDICAVGGDSGE